MQSNRDKARIAKKRARRDRRITQGVLRVERWNDQFRQPNPAGAYPCCKPAIWTLTCERCGGDVRAQRGPCPAVPRDQRWGPTHVEVVVDEPALVSEAGSP